MPLTYRAGGEDCRAFGAPRLAQVGVDELNLVGICKLGNIKQTIMPDPALQRLYMEQYENYKVLKEHF